MQPPCANAWLNCGKMQQLSHVIFDSRVHLPYFVALNDLIILTCRCTNYASFFPTFTHPSQCALETTFTAFQVSASTSGSMTFEVIINMCAGACPVPVSWTVENKDKDTQGCVQLTDTFAVTSKTKVNSPCSSVRFRRRVLTAQNYSQAVFWHNQDDGLCE